MKNKFLLFLFLCVLVVNVSNVEAATDEMTKTVLMSSEFSVKDLPVGNEVLSFEDIVFELESGEEVIVTSEISQEEFLPLDEAVRSVMARTWNGCYASPGTYNHKYTFTVNRPPFKGTLIGNTRFKLTTSSIAIESVNTGGTNVQNYTYTANAKKLHSTLSQFNFKLTYPGNALFAPQSKDYTLETELGFINNSSGLMYRTIINAYY